MRLAVVRSNIVINVIEAVDAAAVAVGEGEALVESAVASPGWSFDGARFVPPATSEAPPEHIQLWQARAVLKQAGLLDAANSFVQASASEALQAAWEYGNTISRHSAALAAIAGALKLTAAQTDDLFSRAARLQI